MNTWEKEPYRITTDPNLLQLDWITATLGRTYWGAGIRRESIAASLAGSRAYGMYDRSDGQQVGFARVITDGVMFAWLCDVVVDESRRGRGLGRWLVETIIQDPALGTVTFRLATRDAHGLYERYGFAREEILRRPRPAPPA